MFLPEKSVRLLLALCLAFVGLAAAIRVSDTQKSAPPAAQVAQAVSAGDAIPSSPDPSFFATDKKAETGASSAKPPAKEPVRATAPAAPTVTAESYLVGDIITGEIYMQKNIDAVLPVASMSKLITALVVKSEIDGGSKATITEDQTKLPPDGSNLLAGETFTAEELLYPMLLNSSNVAAEALASSIDRQSFLELMVGYAWEIGMPKSFFADPTGLSERNAATSRDFFALARYLYSDRPDILAITRTIDMAIGTTSDHGSHSFVNIHPFVRDPRFIGGKTGQTPAAMQTMLTIMDIGGTPVAFIVLRSAYARERDTALLIEKLVSAR